MRIPRLRNAPAPDAQTAGVFTGDGAAVAHELTRPRESGELADFGHDGDRRDVSDAAQRLEGVDDGAHRGRGRLHRHGEGLLEPSDPLAGVVDLAEVVQPRGLLRRPPEGAPGRFRSVDADDDRASLPWCAHDGPSSSYSRGSPGR